MALWNGLTLNTEKLASAINKWHADTFVPMVVKNNGLLYAMKNKEGAPTNPMLGKRFDIRTNCSGNALNVRLLGALPAPAGLADSAQGTAIGNFTYASSTARMGAATFEWSHFAHTEPIYMDQMKAIRGDEAKTISFMQDKVFVCQKGWESVLGTALMGTGAPARTTWGGIHAGVAGATGSYGGVDRTDAANVDFTSYTVSAPGGSLTLDLVDDCQLEIVKAGGAADFAVCGKTPYKKLLQELRGYAVVKPQEWSGFSGKMIGQFNGVNYVFDHRGDDTSLIIGDSSGATLYLEEGGIGKLIESRQVYPGVSHVLPMNTWGQFVIIAPSWWAKVTDITN